MDCQVVRPDDPILGALALSVDHDRTTWHSVLVGLDDQHRPLVGFVFVLDDTDPRLPFMRLEHLLTAPGRAILHRVQEAAEAIRAHVRSLGYPAVVIRIDLDDPQAAYLRRILRDWQAELVCQDDDGEWYVREV